MKFVSILGLGMIAIAVDAAYPNPGNGPVDACYTGALPQLSAWWNLLTTRSV